MAHATTLGFGGWPRFLMMSAAFIRVIIRVARSNSLGVGRVGLKQTASESASVAEVDVQLLALLVVSAVTVKPADCMPGVRSMSTIGEATW